MFISKESYREGQPKNINGKSVQKAQKPVRGLQITPSHAATDRADNGNLRNFGATYRYSTVFTPMQCTNQKEVIRNERPKI